MPRTRSVMSRAALEEATLERIQAEAKKYKIPVSDDKFDLIEKIMSHIERQEPQELWSDPQSEPRAEQGANEKKEPLTASTFRSTLNEVTKAMRQQQQSIQLVQLMTNQVASQPLVTSINSQSLNAEVESRVSSAPTLSREAQPVRNLENNIPGNSVSWLATQIPEFGGTDKESVDTWVQRVDQIAGVHAASDGITLLAASSKLTKFAKTWYEVQSGAAIESWIGLRAEMIKKKSAILQSDTEN